MTLDRRLVTLLVLTAVFPAVEATVLVAMGFVAAEGIAPQVSAVWPYDTYHDLRWLFVYHQWWPEFVLWLVYVALTRGALTTVLVALAWPVEVPRPPVRQLLKRNVADAGQHVEDARPAEQDPRQHQRALVRAAVDHRAPRPRLGASRPSR
ncbi:hypothetical protein ABT344_10970 [Micromonospora carbonacea]|uniref:hypothetical protein n=1 Tax=Micromonospora carbonacea TaxID=47853 RepID=UPI00332FFD01